MDRAESDAIAKPDSPARPVSRSGCPGRATRVLVGQGDRASRAGTAWHRRGQTGGLRRCGLSGEWPRVA